MAQPQEGLGLRASFETSVHRCGLQVALAQAGRGQGLVNGHAKIEHID